MYNIKRLQLFVQQPSHYSQLQANMAWSLKFYDVSVVIKVAFLLFMFAWPFRIYVGKKVTKSKVRRYQNCDIQGTWGKNNPDSKVHVANMGPPGSCRPQMGPLLAPSTLLSGYCQSGIGCGQVFLLNHVYIYIIYNETCLKMQISFGNHASKEFFICHHALLYPGKDCNSFMILLHSNGLGWFW